MFGSESLEVGIGVTLFFLIVSLLCSAVREGVEAASKLRSGLLERGIREMLSDPLGTGTAGALFGHGQISSLFSGSYDPTSLAGKDPKRPLGLKARRDLPSYIPAGQFASALIDLVAYGRANPAWPYPVAPTALAAPLTVGRLREAVARLPDRKLQGALLAAIDHAGGDLAKVKENVERWFDGTMDRVSGWYKRRTQIWLFCIGLDAAAVLNLDAITVTHRLVADKSIRDAFVSRAEKVVGDGTAPASSVGALKAQLDQIKAPIGWSPWPQAEYGGAGGLVMVLGWLVTALAATFGAPFWFDVLNKFMVIRSTVKPREKSQEEGSEDRLSAPARQVMTSPDSTGGGGGGQGGGGSPPPVAPSVPPAPDDAALAFAPEQWRDDFVNTGEVRL